MLKGLLSYFTDLQGSQTNSDGSRVDKGLSYFTDLQGSQTFQLLWFLFLKLSYFTDLQGSQTIFCWSGEGNSLVTLLIYKVLKPQILVITEPSILAYV